MIEKKPRLGMITRVAIYLLLLVFFGNIHALHPALQFRGWGMISVAIGVIALLGTRSKQSLRRLYQISPIFKYVLFTMVLVYVSVPFSVYKSGSFNDAKGYLFIIAFFFMLLMLAKGEPGLRALLNCGMAIFVILALAVYTDAAPGRATFEGSTYDPNDVAYILVSMIPLVFYYMQTVRSKMVKMGLAGILLLGLLAVAYTQSRGGMISFAMVALMILRFEKVSFKKVIIPLILVTLLAVFFVPESFWDRMSTLKDIESDYNMTSGAGRIEQWKSGLRLFGSHFFTGVGVGQFAVANGMFGIVYMTAHNAYIQVATELGVFGIYSYLMMVLGPLRWLGRQVRSPKRPDWRFNPMYKGLFVAFVGQAVGAFFLSVGYFYYMYYLLVLFFVLNAINDQGPKQTTPAKDSKGN